ncbi:MAG: class I SAM-dependent methyltransferase, partial [Anaerolineaceae bacterium]|nr:class I SAM-dependent methyltransferase [Anaerolineaceae bacterium]
TPNDPDIIHNLFLNDEALRTQHETHERFSVPQVDFAAWALSCVQWRGDECVLDVGCGPGRWHTPLVSQHPGVHYYGIDLHDAMLENHPARSFVTIGDATHLPYPDNMFDVVMANHMLFHVQDIDHTIQEFRRVLKPDGVLMTTTNSAHNLPELQVLLRRAITLLAPPGTPHIQPPQPASTRFTLENGVQQLSHHFFAVVRHDLPSLFVFPSADPIVDYLNASRSVSEAQLPEGVQWNDVLLIVREQADRLVEHFGELVINKLNGVLIATDRGDFIRPYLEHQAQSNGK